MQRNIKLTLLLVLTAALSASGFGQEKPAIAHGANIAVRSHSVEIEAAFDTGEPMANAQVAIYAPDQPKTPVQTGVTDSEGRFLFTPEDDGAGLWEVTVRQAGHGEATTFTLDAAGSGEVTLAAPPTADLQADSQKWIRMAAVVCGLVGIASYFLSRERRGAEPALATTAAASPTTNPMQLEESATASLSYERSTDRATAASASREYR